MPRGGSRTAAISKMELVIIVNGWKPLTIITKRSILDVGAALDPPLMPMGGRCKEVRTNHYYYRCYFYTQHVFAFIKIKLERGRMSNINGCRSQLSIC